MALENLPAALERKAAVTSATQPCQDEVIRASAPMLACTPITLVTPQNCNITLRSQHHE